MDEISVSHTSVFTSAPDEFRVNRVLDYAQKSQVSVEKTEEQRLSPGEWLRAVDGFGAPFGFDRMPTVWG